MCTVYSAFSQLYFLKFSFKFANISRRYDDVLGGPLFMRTLCRVYFTPSFQVANHFSQTAGKSRD